MTVRFMIEQYMFCSRRTASRAAVRWLQQNGGWMFEIDNNGKWE